jgi:hypothetical protein
VTAQGGDMIDLLTIEEIAERLRTVGQLAGRQGGSRYAGCSVHDLRHTAASLWLTVHPHKSIGMLIGRHRR